MRRGIISVGNWLVDTIKFIEKYPVPGHLVNITRIETGLGGCAHNVLVDLARLATDIPLYAGGCIGADSNGQYVMNEIEKHRLDPTYMHITQEAATSYTDVMSEIEGKHTRTFFHYKGANALLGPEHFENIDTQAKIFHLGYLLLLDRLDEEDPEYGRVAARILDNLQKKGYKTSVDVVSEESDRFEKIVLPCLPYVDYFIVNEVEAGACCGESLRNHNEDIDLKKVEETTEFLMSKGVKDTCVIHFPEGGFAMNRNKEKHFVPVLKIQKSEIVSSVGAGDAFCAGMLYALHEEMPLKDALIFANASAWFNLTDATSTGGAPKLETINEFIHLNKQYYEKI